MWIQQALGRKLQKAPSLLATWVDELLENDFTHVGHLCDADAVYLQSIVKSGRAANLICRAAKAALHDWQGATFVSCEMGHQHGSSGARNKHELLRLQWNERRNIADVDVPQPGAIQCIV